MCRFYCRLQKTLFIKNMVLFSEEEGEAGRGGVFVLGVFCCSWWFCVWLGFLNLTSFRKVFYVINFRLLKYKLLLQING